MSSHAATVSLGRTGSASGDLKTADVVGHLYIGGAGMWRFHVLRDDDERSVALPSGGFGFLWQEVAAGLALSMHDQQGFEHVATGMAAAGIADPVADARRLDGAAGSELARLVGEMNVAAALTVFGGPVPEEVNDLSAVPGWSVQVAAPVFERLHSRWGTSDTSQGGPQ